MIRRRVSTAFRSGFAGRTLGWNGRVFCAVAAGLLMVTLALWTTVMAPGGNPPVLKWVDTTDTTQAAGTLVGDGSAADVVLQYMRFLYTQDTEYAPFDQSSMFVETYLPLVGHVDTRGQMSDNMFDGLIFYDGLLGANEGPRYGK